MTHGIDIFDGKSGQISAFAKIEMCNFGGSDDHDCPIGDEIWSDSDSLEPSRFGGAKHGEEWIVRVGNGAALYKLDDFVAYFAGQHNVLSQGPISMPVFDRYYIEIVTDCFVAKIGEAVGPGLLFSVE